MADTVLDKKLVPKVLALIAKYGKDVVFVEPGDKRFSVEEGENQDLNSTRYDAKITPPAPKNKSFKVGDTVVEGMVEVYLAAKDLEFDPTPALKVEIDSESWNIVTVGPIYTGNQKALYRLELAK